MSDRPTRKEMKQDRFVQDVGTAYGYANRNRRNILLGIAGVVALIAVFYGVSAYRSSQERKAHQLLSEAIAVMDASSGAPQVAAEGAPEFGSDEEKFAKAQPLLQTVVDKHSGTDAADVAELYLANIAAARGDVEGARGRLEGFVRSHPGHLLAGAAQLSLYEMRLQPQEVQSLISELEQKVAEEEPALPKDALLSLLARAWELQGDSAKARQAYERIISEFPDSTYTMDAQRRLATV